MTGQESFAAHLLPGERVGWTATPQWARAARPPRRWLALVGMIALAAVVTLAAILIIDASDAAEPMTLARAVSAVAILVTCALTIYLWIRTVARLFALFERPEPRPNETYALTDRRLIVLTGTPAAAKSITTANVLLEATLRPNGHVQDLALWFGPRSDDEFYDYDEPVLLRALDNGADVKRQLIERFGPRPVET